ncbi:MAG: hypothetical protein IJ222_05365 [Bacteroidales bacterium]|nr:hypothetical protein [Bacteroidales bacterium]
MTNAEMEVFIEKYLALEWRQVARDMMSSKGGWVHTPAGFLEAIIEASEKAAKDKNSLNG